jgi:DNA polymerase III epsilon subunit-like protein
MSRSDLVFLDIETTGLDPTRHEVWEIAIIEADSDAMHHWLMNVQALSKADPGALRVNKYYERIFKLTAREQNFSVQTKSFSLAIQVATLLLNKTIIGNNPSFDATFLDAFLRSQGVVPAWNHSLVCVKSLVGGKLGLKPPYDTKKIAEAIGVPLPKDAHTARADATWVRDVYHKLYGGTS